MQTIISLYCSYSAGALFEAPKEVKHTNEIKIKYTFTSLREKKMLQTSKGGMLLV